MTDVLWGEVIKTCLPSLNLVQHQRGRPLEMSLWLSCNYYHCLLWSALASQPTILMLSQGSLLGSLRASLIQDPLAPGNPLKHSFNPDVSKSVVPREGKTVVRPGSQTGSAATGPSPRFP